MTGPAPEGLTVILALDGMSVAIGMSIGAAMTWAGWGLFLYTEARRQRKHLRGVRRIPSGRRR